ncbi:MAG TPA: YtxH domain-containing protein [Bacteroidia bacterium]|nr:YtxH domain-containing protein [Bacteroidia bacterium]
MSKLITGVLIGAGAALVMGYLLTDEKSEIRKKITESGGGVLDFLCNAFDKGKEVVKEYSEDLGKKANAEQQ